ncbi:MAG TPA: ATP-binding cassette domain-containing protein [Anaerolineae bacterium]|nr:ATP-binding cassette domain-containing protein [Anaerolineae bacterium]
MQIIEIDHVAKSFGDVQAVVDASFNINKGEIFGLLGPNGAGKTTTIRILLDLFRPDQGRVSILGGPMTEEKKNRIGYMPEERGLYQEVTTERCLLYLASLKGIPAATAKERLDTLLERFDLADHRNKKIKELSKGMQQKAQIINTVIHAPELIIIDEPFTSLDPINMLLVKELIRELREQGTTIVMSTHQMHQVEELCDRIVLIDEGRDVLYGNLDEIRERFSGDAVVVQTQGDLPKLPGVTREATNNDAIKLSFSPPATPQSVLKDLLAADAIVERFEIAVPTLDEIFIRVVEGRAR